MSRGTETPLAELSFVTEKPYSVRKEGTQVPAKESSYIPSPFTVSLDEEDINPRWKFIRVFQKIWINGIN